MEYIIETNRSKNLVTIRVSGDLTKTELAPLGVKVRLRAKKEHSRLLFDFRRAKNNLEIIDAHNWIADHYDVIDKQLKLIPTAHLANPDDIDFFKFVETSWSNRGVKIRLFNDERVAVEWLESQRPL